MSLIFLEIFLKISDGAGKQSRAQKSLILSYVEIFSYRQAIEYISNIFIYELFVMSCHVLDQAGLCF